MRGIPRRRFVGDSLAAFAAALAAPSLGCSGNDIGDSGPPDDAAGPDDAGPDDTGPNDTGAPDAAPYVFRSRDVPDAPLLRSRISEIGELLAPNADGVRLPPGFSARIIARSGDAVPGTDFVWPFAPDGGATFRTEDGGYIYVRNSELPVVGGASALRFDADATLVGARSILGGTNMNCSGGPTPWHTWLSCEEWPGGLVYETDPWGEQVAVVRHALGHFRHEALAIDPVSSHVYLTEDERDGRLYRYVPDGLIAGRPNLAAGSMEVARVGVDGEVSWLPLPDPQYEGDVATRRQVAESTAFDGGEGIWYHNGVVYFSTKGDERIWAYDVADERLRVMYDGLAHPSPPLLGVDAIVVSCCGDVLVAEDDGSMQVVAITPEGMLTPVVQIVGQDESEVTGIAFDPSGTRLYFSSQRGPDGYGLTYEMMGPFHAPA